MYHKLLKQVKKLLNLTNNKLIKKMVKNKLHNNSNNKKRKRNNNNKIKHKMRKNHKR